MTDPGTAIEFEVDPNDKVGAIKQKIGEKTGIPVNRLTLLGEGRIFNVKQTFSEQGIVDGSTLHLAYSGPGG
ncbi:MAG: hypothetical protein EZS28_005504 [Streblomastix strix]|uniref:Ubiquitin-like domain-containing protein n=1 Tax=Streblomastix strix TaxID=222440 RepID=A0A5J4WWP4_9EUKA|nr:MAG: hypothetical protein EZS28_005504 [Streblomastix strix]